MNNDDSRGNQSSYQHRRPSAPNKNTYSPNSVYYGNSNHSNHSNHNNQQQQQKKKHFSGGFSKGPNNNDRLMKQNDTIIKLLKEIRDRLPAPAGTVNNENGDDFDQKSNPQGEKRLVSQNSESAEMDNEEDEDTFGNTEDGSFEVENEQD